MLRQNLELVLALSAPAGKGDEPVEERGVVLARWPENRPATTGGKSSPAPARVARCFFDIFAAVYGECKIDLGFSVFAGLYLRKNGFG